MKRSLMFNFVLLIALALAGCAKNGTSPGPWPPFLPQGSHQQINPSILQQDLMSFADRFSSAIADAYDRADDEVTTTEAKEVALGRKVGHLTAAISNAVDDNPVVGLLDMLVMTTLTRASTEDAWFKELFGEAAPKLTAACKRQEDEIWQIATQYLSAAQLVELRESIDRWRSEHPEQRYVAMVRLSDFSRAKNAMTSGTSNPGSVFSLLFLDPFASLDPAVREVERSRETAQRMFYYLQRMPALVSWQAELSARRSLDAPQVGSFLTDTSRFTQSTLRFADATRAVAEAISRFPQFMTEERQRAVDQAAQKIAEQRDAAIQQTAAAVAVERDAAIKQLAAAVSGEREAAVEHATTRASAEGEAMIQQFHSMLESERAGLVRDLDSTASSLIRQIIRGQVIVVLISVVIVVLGALTYRWLRPR